MPITIGGVRCNGFITIGGQCVSGDLAIPGQATGDLLYFNGSAWVGSGSVASPLAVIGSGTDDATIRLLSTNAGKCEYRFGDPDDPDIGIIRYNHSVNAMTFVVAAGNQAVIQSGTFRAAVDDGLSLGTDTVRFLNSYFNNVYIDGALNDAGGSAGDNGQVLKSTGAVIDWEDDLKMILLPDVSDPLTVRDNIAPADFPIGYACEIVEVILKVRTAPTGADIKVEIEKSGAGDESMITAVSSTNCTIAAGSKYGGTTTIASGALAKNSIIRANIDQIGSGTAGSILSVLVIVKRT